MPSRGCILAPLGGAMAEAVVVSTKPRFFYGWVIVGVSMMINMMSGSLATVFGLFIIPMQSELGWSRTTIVFTTTIAALLGAVTHPLVGPIVDRYGGRVLMVATAVVGGTFIALSSQAHVPWQFYLLYGVLGTAVIQSAGAQVTSVVVAKWFVAKRGRALGFAFSGLSLGSFVMIPTLTLIINELGWRSGFVVMGVLLAVGIALPAGLFLRRNPEDMGLLPDGVQPAAAATAPPREEQSWTLGQALRTRTLWLLLAAWLFASFPLFAYFIHVIPYLRGEKEFGNLANVAWTTWFAFAFASKLVWGYLSEHIPPRFSVAACFLGEAAGLVVLLNVGHSVPMLFLWSVVGGIGHGPFAQLQTLIWADYYGRPFLGTIRGVLSPPTILGPALAPLLAAYVFQQQHSYRTVWLLFVVLFLVGTLLVLLATPPKAGGRKVPAPAPP
ncbi:MAG: MFS transporter [Dehalococcoidia bacterium]|nr:MFS transporter [Dehalococcoidia bacterium]